MLLSSKMHEMDGMAINYTLRQPLGVGGIDIDKLSYVLNYDIPNEGILNLHL